MLTMSKVQELAYSVFKEQSVLFDELAILDESAIPLSNLELFIESLISVLNKNHIFLWELPDDPREDTTGHPI